MPTTTMMASAVDAGPQAQPQRVERARLTERVEQLAGRAVEEDRQHRQHQERQRERQRRARTTSIRAPRRPESRLAQRGGARPVGQAVEKALRELLLLRALHDGGAVRDRRLQLRRELDRRQRRRSTSVR